jgi:hypothetical protein
MLGMTEDVLARAGANMAAQLAGDSIEPVLTISGGWAGA